MFVKPNLVQPKLRPTLQAWLVSAQPKDQTRLMCCMEVNKREQVLAMFAARNIHVITEVTPIFAVNATVEQISALEHEPLLVWCDLPVTYQSSPIKK